MKPMTCQASACLDTRTSREPPSRPPPGLAGVVRRRHWGSQASAAASAGSAHRPKVSQAEPSEALYNGTAISEPRIAPADRLRSEGHTSELQSRPHLVCRLLLEKKKKQQTYPFDHPLTPPNKTNTER